MSENFNVSKAGLIHLGHDKKGYLGRYIINEMEKRELEQDTWREGTEYHIYPATSSSDEFYSHCLSILAATAPEDIFSSLTVVERSLIYVPMVYTDGTLICLDNSNRFLVHGLLKNGTISNELVTKTLGISNPFDIHIADKYPAEFMSIMLTIKDVWYISRLESIHFDKADNHLQVYLVPVHSIKIRYNNNNFTIMSLADKDFTSFKSDNPLPQDCYLNGEKIGMPWLSIGVLFIITISMLGMLFYGLWWLLFECKFDFFMRIILLVLPIMIIYQLAFKIYAVAFSILGAVILPIDTVIAKAIYRKAIKKNLEKKRSDLYKVSSLGTIKLPDVSEAMKFESKEFAARYKKLAGCIQEFKSSALKIK